MLWADSTVDDGTLTFTKIGSGGAASVTRSTNVDPGIEYAGFGSAAPNTVGGGTISWKTPGGAQVSGTWHGNGPGPTTACRFDALLVRHH